MNVTKCHELCVCCANGVGVGAELFARLVGLGANVIAFNGWEFEEQARFMIIVDEQVDQARAAMEAQGYTVEYRTAIAVDLANRPGSLVALLRTLADANIDVIRSYATGTTSKTTKVVLQTSDNQMAGHVISTIPGRA